MSLTIRTKQALIAKAHTLHPIVIIGNEGLTQAVLLEIDRGLYDHELIKIKLPSAEKSEKIDILQSITSKLAAENLKLIGHIAILYRLSDKKRKQKALQQALKERKEKRSLKQAEARPQKRPQFKQPTRRMPKDR